MYKWEYIVTIIGLMLGFIQLFTDLFSLKIRLLTLGIILVICIMFLSWRKIKELTLTINQIVCKYSSQRIKIEHLRDIYVDRLISSICKGDDRNDKQK
jgi:hypothetical protein